MWTGTNVILVRTNLTASNDHKKVTDDSAYVSDYERATLPLRETRAELRGRPGRSRRAVSQLYTVG